MTRIRGSKSRFSNLIRVKSSAKRLFGVPAKKSIEQLRREAQEAIKP